CNEPQRVHKRECRKVVVHSTSVGPRLLFYKGFPCSLRRHGNSLGHQRESRQIRACLEGVQRRRGATTKNEKLNPCFLADAADAFLRSTSSTHGLLQAEDRPTRVGASGDPVCFAGRL